MPLLDYTLTITSPSSGSIRLGEAILLQSSITIDHPVGASPTETYEWSNHNGDIIGSTQDISYTPSESGHYSVQVLITYEDLAQSYSRSVSQDYSFYVLGRSEKEYSFTSSYLYNKDFTQYSNMDIHRFLSYNPMWSSAYKNFYSNFSKFMSPLMESMSNKVNDIDNYYENNTNIDGVNHFGYRNNQYEIVSLNIPSLIKTEHGYCEYIGQHGQASLETYPIKAVSYREPTLFSKQSFIVDSESRVYNFAFSTTLYLADHDAHRDRPNTVAIIGLNNVGETISEVLTLNSAVPMETLSHFKTVYRVESTYSFKLSNYLDLSQDNTSDNGLNLQKRITNTSGEYFDPTFQIEDSTVYIINSNNLSRNDEYKFDLRHTPDKFFVNNLLDVIYLSGSSLYAGKFMLDYYNLSPYNSSCNNNEYIYLEDETSSVSEDMVVVIETDRLKELGSKSFRISILHNDETMFIDKNSNATDLPDNWIDLSLTGDRVYFYINKSDTSPYTFILETDNRLEPFAAMSYINDVKPYEIASGIKDIFVYNKELWVQNNDDSYNILDPIRLVYTSGVNRIYLFNDFEQVQFVT